jgi:hypothetical protein
MHEGSVNSIAPGMPVTDPEGHSTGARVEEVLVDEGSGIFVGLAIHSGNILSNNRLFVPGENVFAVHEGQVQITVPLSQLESYLSPAEKLARAQEAYASSDPLDNITV